MIAANEILLLLVNKLSNVILFNVDLNEEQKYIKNFLSD